jgi:hypothetical protein
MAKHWVVSGEVLIYFSFCTLHQVNTERGEASETQSDFYFEAQLLMCGGLQELSFFALCFPVVRSTIDGGGHGDVL